MRRRRRVRGASPIARRRTLSAWRSQKASATARLRTTMAVAKNSVIGTRPMSRRLCYRHAYLTRSRQRMLGTNTSSDPNKPSSRPAASRPAGLALTAALPGPLRARDRASSRTYATGSGPFPRGRAHDPVVAVFVVSADATELVAGKLGCCLVVGQGLFCARSPDKRHLGEEAAWRTWPVAVPVVKDRPLARPFSSPVTRVEIHHQAGASSSKRQGEALWDSGEHSPSHR